MSYQHVRAVYYNVPYDDTNPTQQSVLAALAFHLNHATGLCCPSVETLMHVTRHARRTIYAALSHLKRMSYVSVGKAFSVGGRQYNTYTLSLPMNSGGGGDGSADERLSEENGGVSEEIMRLFGSESVDGAEGGAPDAQAGAQDAPPPCGTCTDTVRQMHPKNNIKSNIKNYNNLHNKTIGELAALVGGRFNSLVKPSVEKPLSDEESVDRVVWGAFERFWTEYPAICPYKHDQGKLKCYGLYEQARAKFGDGEKFDAAVRDAVARWSKSAAWQTNAGIIPAPINFLARCYWETSPKDAVAPQPVVDVERKRKEDEARKRLADAEARGENIWQLCLERCANFVDGRCIEGARTPPAFCLTPRPPEECRKFLKKSDE